MIQTIEATYERIDQEMKKCILLKEHCSSS